MPAFRRTDGSQNGKLIPTSRTLQARAESSSEAAALHGQKALTPIIAGTISGTCVGVAWLVALIVILLKHYRKKRYKKVGHAERRSSQRRAGEFIVPPDPAVLEGGYQPGERVIIEEKRRWWRKGSRRADSKSEGRAKGKEKAMALGRLGPAPGPRPKPRSQRSDGQTIQNSFRQNDEADITEEEIQHRPYPPFHRLSTIMSIADPQRSLDRIPQPPEPPSKDVSEYSDVRGTDFAASDDYSRIPVPADPAGARAHRYPPRPSHGW